MVRPFSPTDLVAWVRAALRRTWKPGHYRAGDLAIDREERRVTQSGRKLNVSVTEYDLLSELAARAGRVVTSEDSLNGSGDRGTRATRALCTHVCGGFGASWAMTPTARRTSSPSRGSATAYPRVRTVEPFLRSAEPPGGRFSVGESQVDTTLADLCWNCDGMRDTATWRGAIRNGLALPVPGIRESPGHRVRYGL